MVEGLDKAKDSATYGMTLGQRIAHVGGRVTEKQTVEFGSPMAVRAMIQHILRDTAAHGKDAATPTAEPVGEAVARHFTAVELADCVPQTATTSEKDGRLAVLMTYDELRQFATSLVSASPAAPEAAKPHPDDLAVDRFAQAMKDKLAKARDKGRSGWDTCSREDLSWALRDHVAKGDPRDVANFCMFIWALGYSGIAAPTDAEKAERKAYSDDGAVKPEQQAQAGEKK